MRVNLLHINIQQVQQDLQLGITNWILRQWVLHEQLMKHQKALDLKKLESILLRKTSKCKNTVNSYQTQYMLKSKNCCQIQSLAS